MKPFKVDVYVESLVAHSSQLYSGLAMLQDAGKCNVSFKLGTAVRKNEPLVRMDVNGKSLLFDLSDNPEIYSKEWLAKSDYYFKRMLTPELMKTDARLLPYGLNYPVFHMKDRMLGRAFMTNDKRHWVNSFLRANRLFSKLLNINLSYANNLVHHFEDIPRPDMDPCIIFYTRLWNPDTAKQEWKKKERLHINQTRVELVINLRKEFGSRFMGGIQKDSLSLKLAAGALVNSDNEVYKGSYLKNLRRASIGVATPGLEGSVGFKMAEYVAMSKAIVTSPLNIELPGLFSCGQHYIQYETIDQCVVSCQKLLDDKEFRSFMMKSNYQYYIEFLRPDRLLERALDTIIQ